MRTIWKFPIPIHEHTALVMPTGAKILSVGLDPSNAPSMWCEVDSAAKPVPRDIYVIGTGNTMPSKAVQHVGSFRDGPFMWHVYTR